MKALSNFIGWAFVLLAVMAFYGAMKGAYWHYGTATMCICVAFLFLTDDPKQPDNTSMSKK